MAYDPRNLDRGDLPDEFVDSLESYILGVISIEQIRRRIGSLLSDNQDSGPGMLTAIDQAYENGYLNGTAYRTLMTEIDLGTSEDEPTEWSEEAETTNEVEAVEEDDIAVEMPAEPEAVAPVEPSPEPDGEISSATDAPDELVARTTAPPVLTNTIAAIEAPTGDSDETAAPAIGTGTLLGHRYLLHEKIGTGSMGEVYRALDRDKEAAGSAEPWVAVKIVSQEFSRNPNSLEALKQEAAHGQRLAHPNIIRVFDFDWDGDQFFITMEWLEGKSLVDLLNGRRFRPLPLEQANSIIHGLCHGLSYAHANGIVHADIKPGNVLITRAGHTKLLDFGIARVIEGAPVDFDATSIGAHTPAYSSCEVLEGGMPEPSDDVYSLACLAYRLLAGRRAFGGATAVQAESRNLAPQRIATLNDSQWRALQGALTLRRVHRTSDVATFLAEFSGQDTVDMTRPMPSPGPRQTAEEATGSPGIPLKYGLPALAATLLAIALVLWWPQPRENFEVATAPTITQPEPATDDTSTAQVTEVAPELADPSTTQVTESAVEPAPETIEAAETPVDQQSVDVAAPADATTGDRVEEARPQAPAEAPAETEVVAPLVPLRDDTGAEQFESLLEAANQRMDDGHLIEPATDNAGYFVTELEKIAPDSPELQQTRLRLANLMLLEAMVAINDGSFTIAEEWIAQTRTLDIPDAMTERYETELQEARDAKAARDSDTLSAIFASATPAAILANPDVSFEPESTRQPGDATAGPANPQATTLAMVLPGAYSPPAGEAAATATATAPEPEPEPEPEPQITPLSALEFRRFVEPEHPRGSAAATTDAWVEVSFRVDEKGKTVNIRVVDSEPAELFDQAALSAIRRWRFKPYLVDGQATATDSGVRLRFKPE